MQHCHGNLQRLEISKSCDNINSIVLDYFPMLEVLSLESCENLESLTCSEQPHPPMLPFRTRFQLKDCPKFVSFPHGGLHAPNLEDFRIEDCNMLRLKISDSCDSMKSILLDYFPKLNELDLDYCVNLESFEFSQSPRPALHSLRCFKLTTCPKFVSFPQGGLAAPNMDEFHIEDCKNFRGCNKLEFPGKQCYASLRRLDIMSSCDFMTSIHLDCLPMLNELLLGDLQSLESLTFLERPASPSELMFLRYMELHRCPEFVSFPQGGLSAPNMQELWIMFMWAHDACVVVAMDKKRRILCLFLDLTYAD
ncbi:hypothetical protein FEM48_Zijuj05G0034600 [Ziziphus jujuba var. spinosa]|uniref:Disease resistance protein At3g14460 n=1 Tax=Ziziphus jujuba var. spinosa TaxID=714518 RepID=A0A978VCJ8_ZIZJJ|nr:hypothetical protein FEM48_Zijuj05G0034600 [Ziziphus jujuba var. spinosa]